MLKTYGTVEVTAGDTEHDCRAVLETEPFSYDAVCYIGPPDHRTIIFSSKADHNQRGVFYRPDNRSPEPSDVCVRPVFGRWWQFAPLNDPHCPNGFRRYTGFG